MKKLIDAGLVCVYDGDRLRLTEYGLQVAEKMRMEEKSRLRSFKRR
ncbi:hypothetical protein [Methanocella conradii]|nr:hypothetical protein [Methanocella conradii]MDI6896429.1 hypothetical protein [Methanocella conradii]